MSGEDSGNVDGPALHDYAHRVLWLNWLFPVQVESLDPDDTLKMTFSDYAEYDSQRDPVF